MFFFKIENVIVFVWKKRHSEVWHYAGFILIQGGQCNISAISYLNPSYLGTCHWNSARNYPDNHPFIQFNKKHYTQVLLCFPLFCYKIVTRNTIRLNDCILRYRFIYLKTQGRQLLVSCSTIQQLHICSFIFCTSVIYSNYYYYCRTCCLHIC